MAYLYDDPYDQENKKVNKVKNDYSDIINIEKFDIEVLNTEFNNFSKSLATYNCIFHVNITERTGTTSTTCIPNPDSLNVINRKSAYIKDYDTLLIILDEIRYNFVSENSVYYYAKFASEDSSFDHTNTGSIIDLWSYCDECSIIKSLFLDNDNDNQSNRKIFRMISIKVDILTVHGMHHINECKDDEFFHVSYTNHNNDKSKQLIAHSSFNLIDEILGDKKEIFHIGVAIKRINFLTLGSKVKTIIENGRTKTIRDIPDIL